MVSSRKWRVLVLAALLAGLVVLIYTRRDTLPAVREPQQQLSLLETANNDKVDEAINLEISKEKDGTAPQKQLIEDASAPYDPAKEFLQIRSLAPMTVFSKSYCPYSKRLKKLLHDSYSITPEPTIVELDKHKHGQELQDYLGTLTGRSTVPNVLVGAGSVESRGGADDFVELHKAGKLAEMLNLWGDKHLAVKRVETPSNM